MIAYCGIRCYECAAYKGTVTGDETLLAEMNARYGTETTDAIDFVCLGCKFADVRLIATDCAGQGFLCDLRRIRDLRYRETLPGRRDHASRSNERFPARQVQSRQRLRVLLSGTIP